MRGTQFGTLELTGYWHGGRYLYVHVCVCLVSPCVCMRWSIFAVICLVLSTSLTMSSLLIRSSWPSSITTLDLLGTLETHKTCIFLHSGRTCVTLYLICEWVFVLAIENVTKSWTTHTCEYSVWLTVRNSVYISNWVLSIMSLWHKRSKIKYYIVPFLAKVY